MKNQTVDPLAPDLHGNRTAQAVQNVEFDTMRGWKELTEATAIPERANSERANNFLKLVETVRRMAVLPDVHDLHIDIETAKRAEIILSMLMQNFDVNAPKMFPHEGDSLVLTWDSGHIKRLFAVDGSDLELMDINKATMVRCKHDLSFETPADVKDWIFAIGGVPSSSTTR